MRFAALHGLLFHLLPPTPTKPIFVLNIPAESGQQYGDEIEYTFKGSTWHDNQDNTTNEMAQNDRRSLVIIEGCSFNIPTAETLITTNSPSTYRIPSKKRRKDQDFDPYEEKNVQILENYFA